MHCVPILSILIIFVVKTAYHYTPAGRESLIKKSTNAETYYSPYGHNFD